MKFMYKHIVHIHNEITDELINTITTWLPYSKEEIDGYDYFVIEGKLYQKMYFEDGILHCEKVLGDVCVAYNKEDL